MRLIDADALLKHLNDMYLGASPSDTDDEKTAKERRAICLGIDDCIGAVKDFPIANGWISVKDRLPDAAGYECLVCAVNENFNQTHVFTAHTGYGDPGWWTGNVHYMARVLSPRDNRVHPALRITHWMPLPEQPLET